MEPGDEHKNERMKKDVGSDGEEGGETEEPQQKCGKSEGKYRKYGHKKIYVKKEDNAGKNGNLIEPGKDAGLDGEEGGDTGEPQQQKCEKSEALAIGENSNSSNPVIIL
mmetsp:Transcript_19915/g.22033  ORF Transcript_19915/g.22033 Transcript_19915/m.22033 type:complete len:109 (+) Transcript_19915:1-327(+)